MPVTCSLCLVLRVTEGPSPSSLVFISLNPDLRSRDLEFGVFDANNKCVVLGTKVLRRIQKATLVWRRVALAQSFWHHFRMLPKCHLLLLLVFCFINYCVLGVIKFVDVFTR